MKIARFVLIAVSGIVALAAATVHASNPTAVYARVDRVVLSPGADAPQTIQIFGVFSMATPGNPNDYQPPAEGYLYFTAGDDATLARREWSDLKAMAGSHQIVAFGSRYRLKATVRKASDPPASPDVYATGFGLTKVTGDTGYAPVKALLDYRK